MLLSQRYAVEALLACPRYQILFAQVSKPLYTAVVSAVSEETTFQQQVQTLLLSLQYQLKVDLFVQGVCNH